MNLVIASANAHKIKEIKAVLPSHIYLIGLDEIGFLQEIPETEYTLEGNALLKARTVFKYCGQNCFAEDSGLEVEALNYEPGVYSARYAGPQRSNEDNINLLLSKMKGLINRSARFRTVIALIINGTEYLFEGIVKGVITQAKQGESGFGYDPIFIPDGYQRTFAEMTLVEKNQISHRANAIAQLVKFINQL